MLQVNIQHKSISGVINLREKHVLCFNVQGFSSNRNVSCRLPSRFWRVGQSRSPFIPVLMGWADWLDHRNIIDPFLVIFLVHVHLIKMIGKSWKQMEAIVILIILHHQIFCIQFMVKFTSTINTSIAIPRPTKVAMNTPPRDRSVIPSESSRTGHKLRRVLFQYFPKKIKWWSLP